MNRLGSHPPDAIEEIFAKLRRYYGLNVFRILLPLVDTVGRESGNYDDVRNDGPRRTGVSEDAPGHTDEAGRLIMAALLVMLHETGGGYKVSFVLPDLLRLLGWPVADSSWDAVERVLDSSMQPVHHELNVAPPPDGRGPEARITSWRRLVSGYEYEEEFEGSVTEPISNLAGRRVTVTFNPDVLQDRGQQDCRCKSSSLAVSISSDDLCGPSDILPGTPIVGRHVPPRGMAAWSRRN